MGAEEYPPGLMIDEFKWLSRLASRKILYQAGEKCRA